MPKRLTPQAKLSRLHAQGLSDRAIAKVTGFSPSSVGRIRRGQQSGEKISAPLNQFYKAPKRTKEKAVSGEITLPSAKPAPAPRARPSIIERMVSPLERAAGQLVVQDSNAMLVVQVTMKGTGKSKTLFAHGGTSKAHLQGNLRGVISAQYKSQYRGDSLDWDDVISIDIEEH